MENRMKPIFSDGSAPFQKKITFKMSALEKEAMAQAVEIFSYMHIESTELGDVSKKFMFFQVDVLFYVYDMVDYDLFKLGVYYNEILSELFQKAGVN